MTAETGPAPSEAFEILGHETRLAIIEELAKHRRTQWKPSGVGFAELRKSVGVEDAGKFNYHLDKLRDHFVGKRDDEYVLQNTGLELAGAVLAGTYTKHTNSRRNEIDRECPVCDTQLEAVYERGQLTVECPDHGQLLDNMMPPGAAAGRSMDELLAIANRDARHVAEHARGGVCWHCWGEMTCTVPADPAPLLEDRGNDAVEQVLVRFSCERCEMTFWFPVSIFVLDHPSLVSLCNDHDIDLRDRDYLELGFLLEGGGTVVSEDPVRIEVTIEIADDALQLMVDDTLTVVDVEQMGE